jgi:uncharacterized protein with HEPN domain
MLKDNAYLADILDSARIIQQHLAGVSREQFLADQRTQDAVIRRFEIIGEAARHLSPKFHELTRSFKPVRAGIFVENWH